MNYIYLSHTADVKFQASGKNLVEAFKESLKATVGVMIDSSKIKKEIKKEVYIEFKKKESLLYDFLEEILFLLDSEGFIACDAEIKINEDMNTLSGFIFGDKASKYDLEGDIKSITYHDMKIEELNDETKITVVLDI